MNSGVGRWGVRKVDRKHQLMSNLQGFVRRMESPSLLIHLTDGIIVCNDSFLNVSDYTMQDIEQLTPKKLFQSKSIEKVFRVGNENKEEGEYLYWIDKHGSTHCHLFNTCLMPFNGENYALLSMYGYIHEHSSLSPLHLQFSKQIFTNPYIGLILIANDKKIVRITEKASEILGGHYTDFIGVDILKLCDHLPIDRRLINDCLFDGMTTRNKTMTWNNGEQQFELIIDMFPIIDKKEKQIGAYIFLKDMTNVRSLENQIRRSERLAMIGQIAAGTAHEIRNPLTSIKGFLQVLENTLMMHRLTKEYEYTKIMLEEIERINHLVGEFLLLSKEREMTFSKIQLKELLKSVMPMVQNEALLNGIELECADFTFAPMIYGDKEMVKQVCLNLCKNAIEAMGDKGKLTVTYDVHRNEKMVCINFKDNGPGIPLYALDKIFEPFFTTKDTGTGLGLSVCQSIIHDMGGKIRVTSKGYGTTFHVYLPYIDEK